MESVYKPARNQSRRTQHHQRTNSACDCYPACKSHCKNSKSTISNNNNMYNSIDPPDNEYDEESARVLLVQRANNRSSNGRNKGEGPRRRVSHNSSSISPSIASSQYNDPPSNGSGPSVCYSSSDSDSEVGTRDPPLRSADYNDDSVGKRGSGLQRRDVHFASSSQRRPRGHIERGQNNRGGKRAIIVDAEDVSHLTISRDYIDTVDQVSLPNDYDVEAGEVVYDVQTKKKDGGSKRGERRRRVSLDSQSTSASSVESRDTLLKSMLSTVSNDESSIITSGIRGSHNNKYMNNNLSKSINKAKQTTNRIKGRKSNGFISSYPRPISFYNMHNIQRAQLNNNKSKDKDNRTFFQRLFPSAIKEEDTDDSSIHSSSTSSTSSTTSSSSSTSNNSNRTTKSQASQRSKIGRVANSLLLTWIFTLLGAMVILVVYDNLELLIVKLLHSYSADGGGGSGEGSGVGEVMRKLVNVRHAIFHLDAKVDADASGSSSFLT